MKLMQNNSFPVQKYATNVITVHKTNNNEYDHLRKESLNVSIIVSENYSQTENSNLTSSQNSAIKRKVSCSPKNQNENFSIEDENYSVSPSIIRKPSKDNPLSNKAKYNDAPNSSTFRTKSKTTHFRDMTKVNHKKKDSFLEIENKDDQTKYSFPKFGGHENLSNSPQDATPRNSKNHDNKVICYKKNFFDQVLIYLIFK